MNRNLDDILKGVATLKIVGKSDLLLNNLVFDSRKAGKGDLFVAVKGVHADGHQFIPEVIEKGVAAVICEVMPEKIVPNVTYIRVANSALALAKAASAMYDHPSRKLKVIGITGTNGKTSTVFFLYHLFKSLGYKVGLLSTIENLIGDERIASTHTTADAIQINENLHKMVEQGCDYCFMEMSSHAIDQERIAGLKIHGAVFTNITHDHLDYHQTFDKYIKAKKKLFDQLQPGAFALVNADDRNSAVMLQNTAARKMTYSLKSPSDFKVRIIENRFEGLQLQIDQYELHCRLVGSFNAYNLMAVYGVARIEGFEAGEILPEISKSSRPWKGGFQVIRSLKRSRSHCGLCAHAGCAEKRASNHQCRADRAPNTLITLIGAGGDRDRLKRPVLAKVACQLSNKVILTSDNPRSENPDEIIAEMDAGLDAELRKKAVKIPDRREAIKTACMISCIGDIILVAGKGHETYQEIQGVKHHFDDREILNEILNPTIQTTD
jgi:UDP-N-acetylmuramoyl-L-alanyl-D-glutamate--2,6-diaminopimelate ligase